MDKKEAEAEALRKAKDQQASAGKSSGMSGRDLVRSLSKNLLVQLTDSVFSSNTTQNGSRTQTKMKTTGILTSIDRNKRMKGQRLKQSAYGSYLCTTGHHLRTLLLGMGKCVFAVSVVCEVIKAIS